MRKLFLCGRSEAGKTTLTQALKGEKAHYVKTQYVKTWDITIDTPGEYAEHRSFLRALVGTAVEVDQVLFVQDATQERFMYSPGQASAFPVPVAGVVSKADAATEKQVALARELLQLAGADPVFTVSAFTGEGIEDLLRFLQEETDPQEAQ